MKLESKSPPSKQSSPASESKKSSYSTRSSPQHSETSPSRQKVNSYATQFAKWKASPQQTKQPRFQQPTLSSAKKQLFPDTSKEKQIISDDDKLIQKLQWIEKELQSKNINISIDDVEPDEHLFSQLDLSLRDIDKRLQELQTRRHSDYKKRSTKLKRQTHSPPLVRQGTSNLSTPKHEIVKVRPKSAQPSRRFIKSSPAKDENFSTRKITTSCNNNVNYC